MSPEEWNRSLIRTENNDVFLCNDGHDRVDLNERIYFHHGRRRIMIIIQTTPRTEINIVAGVSSSLLHCLSLFFCCLSTNCCPSLYLMFQNKLSLYKRLHSTLVLDREEQGRMWSFFSLCYQTTIFPEAKHRLQQKLSLHSDIILTKSSKKSSKNLDTIAPE